MKLWISGKVPKKLAALCMLLVPASLLVTWLVIPKEQELRYSMQVEVGGKTTIDPSPSLQFGSIKPGGCATKYIRFRNLFLTPVRLSVSKDGEMGNWIHIDEPVGWLIPMLSRKIAVSVFVPEDVYTGEYTGEILVKARRY